MIPNQHLTSRISIFQVLVTLTGLTVNASNISAVIADSSGNSPRPADVVSLQYLTSACSTSATFVSTGCGRSALSLSLPSQDAPCTVLLRVTVNLASGADARAEVAVAYAAACNYDAFCGSGLVVDLKRAVASSIPQCDLAACVDPAAVPDPVLVAVTPSIGSALGGTVVEVGNLHPIFVVFLGCSIFQLAYDLTSSFIYPHLYSQNLPATLILVVCSAVSEINCVLLFAW